MQANDAPAERLGDPFRTLAGQVLRFGAVGAAGFVVDAAVLLLALGAGLGPYAARLPSYLAAATTTWALNRAWTFRGRDDGRPLPAQWARFLLVNLFGGALNYATYAVLVANLAPVATRPVLGVAAGALAGMAGNFLLSRRYVFGGA